ncbi:ribulose-phosphate 3-epimerase [Paenibacillus sp. S150]|uniref:ribulose-phosphate 3-epimerase n=1 Tax=Paenibacillus sp. S150 TaxID=2749826 RepID=UPI001C59E67A|nr:ribulose-phosphate 3-epimerase [Paenibacillus sp. S150]MBW4079842.1 ribulose-phosphate 3-epimerase [Paenibacillus sp. S150]
MTSKLSLSIMCADPLYLGEALQEAKQSGAEFIHADIMDGNFVNNITLGYGQIKRIAEVSSIPVEVHLMVSNLDAALPEVLATHCTHVSFHIEATNHPVKYLRQIHAAGKKAGIALNPHAPVQFLDNIRDYLDYVLVMTVEPGFAGQKFLDNAAPKIRSIREIIGGDKDIVVDGNISTVNALLCQKYGATVFVLGTSVAYTNQHLNLKEISDFRKALQ